MQIKWKLKNLDPNIKEEIIVVRPTFSVGRNLNADISCSYRSLSRNHAEFLVLGDGCLFVEDHMSSNGTFVNDQKIETNTRKQIHNADIVSFGCSIQFANKQLQQTNSPIEYLRYEVIEIEEEPDEVIEILDDTPPPSLSGEIDDLEFIEDAPIIKEEKIKTNSTNIKLEDYIPELPQIIDKSSKIIKPSTSTAHSNDNISNIKLDKMNRPSTSKTTTTNTIQVNIDKPSPSTEVVYNDDIKQEYKFKSPSSKLLTNKNIKQINIDKPSTGEVLTNNNNNLKNKNQHNAKISTKNKSNIENILLDEDIQVIYEPPQSFQYSQTDEFIEISDEDGDDDMFACSQLIKMDQIKQEVKIEPEESFTHCKDIIKNLEELNYLNDLIRGEDDIIEIDYYEDENALLDTLESTQRTSSNINNASEEPPEFMDHADTVLTTIPTKSDAIKNGNLNGESSNLNPSDKASNDTKSTKSKYIIPPVVELHIHSPLSKKAHQVKRKSIDVSIDGTKKLKLSAPGKSKNNVPQDKEEKNKIQNKRKEKLKELSSKSNTSKNYKNNNKNVTKVKVKNSDSRGQFLLEEPHSLTSSRSFPERIKNNNNKIPCPKINKVMSNSSVQENSNHKYNTRFSNNEINKHVIVNKNSQGSKNHESGRIEKNNRQGTSKELHSLVLKNRFDENLTIKDRRSPKTQEIDRMENNSRSGKFKMSEHVSPVYSNSSVETVSDRSDNVRINNNSTKNVKRLNAFLNSNFYNSVILKNIVRWPYKWLLEQKNNQHSPPVYNQKIDKMPDFFKNYIEYSHIISGLLLLEIWRFTFDMWSNNNSSYFQAQIVHKRTVGDLLYIDCEAFDSKINASNIREHSLLLIEMKVVVSSRSGMKMKFGLITKVRVDYIKNFADGTMKKRLSFSVVTKHSDSVEVKLDSVLVQVITNILYYTRLVKTIKSLEVSPLLPLILYPQYEDFKVNASPLSKVNYGVTLNEVQSQIVEEAVHVCTRDEVGFYLIRGPPGTGKSTVIVNIILRILLESDKNSRVLLTAPSNAAVDELIMKLNAAKSQLSKLTKKKIKLVRVGPYKNIHPKVKPYSLHDHTQRQILAKVRQQDVRINAKFETLLAQKSKLLTQFEELKGKILTSRTDLEKKIQEIDKELNPELFLLKNVEKSVYSYYWKNEQNFLLTNCNIICTTLNSCVNKNIEYVMSARTSNGEPFLFDCCIIDEATQCTEIEALTPLQLGIDKFILVGDPQQLPATVLNMEAKKLDYGKSLFTRIASNLSNNNNKETIRTLTMQYRMHPEICQFPNSYFYNNKLISNYNEKNKITPELRPYLVYNIKTDDNDFMSQQYQNDMEIDFVTHLVEILVKTINKQCLYSIGVITPYTLQKEAIIDSLSSVNNYENVTLNVNTVDSFQGQEKDIIIISLVRNTPNQFLQQQQRLNVALTRGKRAVFVIGTYELFKHCNILYDLREDAKKRQLCRDISDINSYFAHMPKDLFM